MAENPVDVVPPNDVLTLLEAWRDVGKGQLGRAAELVIFGNLITGNESGLDGDLQGALVLRGALDLVGYQILRLAEFPTAPQ